MKTENCIVGFRAQQTKSFLAALALLAILRSEVVWAGGGQWNGLGPDGARIEALLLDAQNPDMVFAGTNGMGFVRFNPESRRLVAANDGLLASIVLSLAADPRNAATAAHSPSPTAATTPAAVPSRTHRAPPRESAPIRARAPSPPRRSPDRGPRS